MSASPDVLVESFAAENRSVFRARLTLRQAYPNLGSSKIFELMKPFCVCCRIVGKVPVIYDATGFCQQAPAPTSLSGRSPLKTNWFSGRVSPCLSVRTIARLIADAPDKMRCIPQRLNAKG